MIKFELQFSKDETVKFQLPTKWEELTVGMFEDFNTIDLENQNQSQLLIDMVVNLSKNTITEEQIKKLDTDTFMEIVSYIEFANTTPPKTKKRNIKIGDDKYVIRNVNELTMGEQVSIEMITKEKANVMLGISDIMCIICRKVVDGVIEPFEAEHMNRKSLFQNVKVTDIYGSILFFSNNNGNSKKTSQTSSKGVKLKVIK